MEGGLTMEEIKRRVRREKLKQKYNEMIDTIKGAGYVEEFNLIPGKRCFVRKDTEDDKQC